MQHVYRFYLTGEDHMEFSYDVEASSLEIAERLLEDDYPDATIDTSERIK